MIIHSTHIHSGGRHTTTFKADDFETGEKLASYVLDVLRRIHSPNLSPKDLSVLKACLSSSCRHFSYIDSKGSYSVKITGDKNPFPPLGPLPQVAATAKKVTKVVADPCEDFTTPMTFDFNEANKCDDPIMRALFSAENLTTIQVGPDVEGSEVEYTVIQDPEAAYFMHECYQS